MPERHIERLMRSLEELLVECGHKSEGERIGKIAGQILRAPDLDQALKRLYRVEGLDQFALKLMYYTEQSRDPLRANPSDRILDYQVQDLYALLFTTRREQFVQDTPVRQETSRPEDLKAMLQRFGAAFEKMRKEAYDEGIFKGMDHALLENVAGEVEALHRVAAEEPNRDVASFSSACLRFIRFVIDGKLYHDIRGLNFLENANLTLQTAVEAVGAEDYDSLHQTTRLMEDPSTLFE